MPAIRPVALGPQRALLEQRADGTMLVRAPDPLGEIKTAITDYLVDWAQRTPHTIFVARRNATGAWVSVTYAQALARVGRPRRRPARARSERRAANRDPERQQH